jgi:DNA-binding transcriptional regulator YdaS (Cro superfamily)
MNTERLNAHGPQGANAANTEKRVLGQPGLLVTDVESRSYPSIHGCVGGNVCIEEVEPSSSDIDPPDLGRNVAVPDRNADCPWDAFLPPHQDGGQAFGVGLKPVFVLPP